MKYIGNLFGKLGRTYIPLTMTSEEVDKMENDLKETKHLLNEAMRWVYACRVNNDNQKRMIQKYEDFIRLKENGNTNIHTDQV